MLIPRVLKKDIRIFWLVVRPKLLLSQSLFTLLARAAIIFDEVASKAE
jgi:hypothetical protein